MKHLKEGKKFHRKTDQRQALLKSLMTNLILKNKIRTTESKAKETKRKVEKLITIAKKQTSSSLKQVKKELPLKAAHKLYYEIAPLYLERHGGYTRIIRTSSKRKRDAAELVILELIK